MMVVAINSGTMRRGNRGATAMIDKGVVRRLMRRKWRAGEGLIGMWWWISETRVRRERGWRRAKGEV